MKTKLFVFGVILFMLAMACVPVVFADENDISDSKSYYPKALYFVTLKNRFPETNEFAPAGFVCAIQTSTAPEMDLKTDQLIIKDAVFMGMQNNNKDFNLLGRDNSAFISLIQGKMDITIHLLVNWDTVIIEEDTDMNDIHSARYETVYGLDKPRFSNFKVGDTGATVGITTGASFKILVPRHKL